MSDKSIFIKEVQVHQSAFRKMMELTHSATKAAGIMLLAAIAALVIANTGLHESFLHLIHTEFGFVVGDRTYSMSFVHIVNDVFMAVFFLLVGLEIKYEMTVGELTNIRQAILPIVAAFGGVLVPVIIYQVFNWGNPLTQHGWGVPTATDIAFALGILALLGSRIPSGIRVFLSTLAVADDIIAILVIALFYGQSPDMGWLLAAAAVLLVLVLMNRAHIYALLPYLLVGAVLWLCVFMSGVHSTIAGVLLAFAIPSGSRVNLRSFTSWSGERLEKAHEIFNPDEPIIGQKDYMHNVANISMVARQVIPPATRLEGYLYSWVYFAILPLFALTNADVCLAGTDVGAVLTNPVFFGVMFGLLVGKPVGIMLFSFIVVKSGLANLPEHVSWKHMLGASILGGVGFTMAIFVANLAFDDAMLVTAAKAGILLASALAGILGFALLWLEAKADAHRGIGYVDAVPGDGHIQHADAEAAKITEHVADSSCCQDIIDQVEAAMHSDESGDIKVNLPETTEGSLAESVANALRSVLPRRSK